MVVAGAVLHWTLILPNRYGRRQNPTEIDCWRGPHRRGEMQIYGTMWQERQLGKGLDAGLYSMYDMHGEKMHDTERKMRR